MRDLLRDIEVLRSKIDVEGYQYLSGSNTRRARTGMDLLRTKIRPLRRVLANLVPEAFKLSLSNVGKVPSFRSRRGFLVEENWYMEFFGKLLAESAGKRNTLIHRHAGSRYEGDNVDSA